MRSGEQSDQNYHGRCTEDGSRLLAFSATLAIASANGRIPTATNIRTLITRGRVP